MSKTKYKILIVIPDTPWLELLVDLVKQCGHTPASYVDDQKALAAIEKEKDFAVMVFDWELSKRKFPELFKEAKAVLPKMGRLAFIEQTDGEIKRLVQEKEFCCHVKKTFELEDFENALRKCIKKYEEGKGEE